MFPRCVSEYLRFSSDKGGTLLRPLRRRRLEGKWLGKSPAAVVVGVLSLGHRDFTKWEFLVHREVHF